MNLPVLLELLAKSALLLLGVAALSAAFPRLSAARRHTLWLSAFAALLLLPATKLVSPHWHLPGSPPALASVEFSTAAAPPSPSPGAEATAASRTRPFDPARWLLIGWGAGAILILAYRMAGSWQAGRLVRRASLLTDARLLRLARQAAREIGLREPCAVRLSAGILVPCLAGGWKPTLLLPADALQWSDSHLLAALRHEFAHLLRRDCLTRMAAWLACAFYWPNPLVWIAARRLALAQEHACDDLVLRAGTAPQDYALLLVETARAFTRPSPALTTTVTMAQPSSLEGRVLAIVDDRRDRRPATGSAFLLGTVLVLATASLSAFAQVAPPPVQPSASDAAGASNVKNRAAQIILPRVEFRDASVSECVNYLRQKSRELDPQKQGVPILLIALPSQQPRVTLSLTNVPLYEALSYVAHASKLKLEAGEKALFLKASTVSTAPAFPATEGAAFEKAAKIVLPSVTFRDTPLAEAIDFLRTQARAVDPAKQGVNIVLARDGQASITLQLSNVPLSEAVRYVAGLVGLQPRADADALILE